MLIHLSSVNNGLFVKSDQPDIATVAQPIVWLGGLFWQLSEGESVCKINLVLN